MMVRPIATYVLLLAIGSLPTPLRAQVRLNQIQVIGTHNSYHIQPHASVMALIETAAKRKAEAIAYTHRPLPQQFSELGIRQIELDVYADPDGGHYANPKAIAMVAQAKLPAVPDHDPDGVMSKPGLKIIHAPDIDYLTTVKTFVEALQQVKAWSDLHPRHVPIMILVEVKQDRVVPILTLPLPFDAVALDSIDQEILSVFPLDRIITPDSVRGDSETLREVVTTTGWPTLDSVRGQVIFALDNGGPVRDDYLKDHPSLTGRILFVSVGADHPAAGFMKLNDAVGDFDQIQAMVRQGFLVRTRADSDTRQARENDTITRDKAFESGAQFVSTDYPEPDVRLSDYVVQFPDRSVARSNPVNGDGSTIQCIQIEKN